MKTSFRPVCPLRKGIINAIVVLGFGPLLLLMPDELLQFYAVDRIEPSGFLNTVAGGYGTILTGLGVALISSLKAQPSIGRRGILVLITVTNMLVVILHVSAILKGIENNLAWSLVAITGLLALWGGYLLSKEQVELGS